MRSVAVLLLGVCAAAGLAHAETNFEKKVAVDPHGALLQEPARSESPDR